MLDEQSGRRFGEIRGVSLNMLFPSLSKSISAHRGGLKLQHFSL